MVAKINIGSSLFGALSYNQKKVDAGEAKTLCSNKVFLPMDTSLTLAFCLRSFENHLPQGIKTEKPVVHISLNPHPDDSLSDEQLSVIAQEYLYKMGYGNQPFVVYKHEDIDRHHIHIVSLRVDEKGKKINDKFEFRRSKEATRELEQKYGLHLAEKQSRTEAPQLPNVDYKKGNIKKQIANPPKNCLPRTVFKVSGNTKHFYRCTISVWKKSKGNLTASPITALSISHWIKKGAKKDNPSKHH